LAAAYAEVVYSNTQRLEMRSRAIIITLFLLLSSHAWAVPVLDAAAVKKIDDAANDALTRKSTPGCCVVIGTKDEVLFAKAYGRLTYDADSPAVTLDTIYDMASCSKAVGTTSATAFLVQDGKLKLDDPVSKYIPAWDRDDRRAVTVKNLASHTSGLASYTSASRAEAIRQPWETHADALIKHIATMPLAYKTNESSTYACLNFLTLARVNEEAAGMSQERLLRERLFEPLGMTNSGYYLTHRKKLLCAPTVGGKSFRQGIVHDPLALYYRDGYHCPGNAGLFTTANDLSKFCRMVLSDGMWDGKQVFKPETIDLFSTNQRPEKLGTLHGIGWGISRRYPYATPLNVGTKQACISHSGYTGTFIMMDRLAGTFMIILTNHVYPRDDSPGHSITRTVRTVMLETDPIYKDVPAPAPTRRD
jgi:CubicO group peptidase (beta-lactamase class C family)